MATSADTTRTQPAPGGARRKVVTLLVLAALLLLPLVIGLWTMAENAEHHKSATDWQSNHSARVALENAASLLFLVPLGTTLLGWGTAALFRRRQGVGAAWGAFLGALGLWGALVVGFYIALSHATFVF